MPHFRNLMLVEAEPDRVYRLVAGVDAWPFLMPHVHAATQVRPGRWRMRLVWRWVPFTVALSSLAEPEHRLAEFRLAGWPAIRVTVRCAVDPGPDGSSSIRVAADIVRAPAPVQWLVAVVVSDLCRETLDMVSLLARADRIAHEGIEE